MITLLAIKVSPLNPKFESKFTAKDIAFFVFSQLVSIRFVVCLSKLEALNLIFFLSVKTKAAFKILSLLKLKPFPIIFSSSTNE